MNRPSPWDFRLFLLRHVALLEALSHWTIRLLFPKPLVKARHAYLNAAREHLATPLQVRRDVVDQVFRERGRLADASAPPVPLTPLSAALDSPRLRALYQQWLVDPEYAIEQAQSRGLAIALERGTGRVECVDLTRQYLHLSPLVDIS